MAKRKQIYSITIDEELIKRFRATGSDNFSEFVREALRKHIESIEQKKKKC